MMIPALFALIALFLLFFLAFFRRKTPRYPLALIRFAQNPIFAPRADHGWESEAVFNPAAVVDGGRVHLFYRALGHDGVSRIGYASSADGIHFDERLPYPVYDRGPGFQPSARADSLPRAYRPDIYASGGGWGGCEDPRTVKIDEHIYLSFGIFESWDSMRLAVTSLHRDHLGARLWSWMPHIMMSPPNERNKNWVLFPEKIRGKFAVLHALTPRILVEYVGSLEELHESPIRSDNGRGGRAGCWDAFVRGAAAPPIKTESGWLLLYHAMDPAHPDIGYKLGAMLLDLKDPTRILYRSSAPVLEPKEWYENEGKPGVIYATGAVLFGDDLMVYYGGGDKHIAAARANFREFMRALTRPENAVREVGV